MNSIENVSGYLYDSEKLNSSHSYLLPLLSKELNRISTDSNNGRRLFDLGCGNGSVAAHVASLGWSVTGVDPSFEGISQANRHYPDLLLETGSAYDKLAGKYGQFPVVISLEVVEHLYSPRQYAQTLFELVESGGTAIISTPYHGYLKNLAIAIAGKMDAHFTVLWDNGHIKFWSMETLGLLLKEAGFQSPRFQRVGRIPALAKSMVAVVTKK